MTGRGDDPKPIARGLDRFLSALGAPPTKVTVDVASRWIDIVGSPLARVTTPGSLRDGVLVVTTAEPAVADHLKWSERSVIERANVVLGSSVVRSIRVRVVAG